ncbi:M20/M25/M40 family metallo-hydrolase [Bdellovibrio bacteriovorus]|uniref:M20/M25/M40 family metallo-hydrolase n=1 Tax=Bdellovibrio bacteriovorus TaxID=959 RepID=UPI0021D15DEC|nr:M20/M25/M40 family metallo-hydrolase [Bdellovibrio bacteriovorus]UXR64082.1 M20/M25/M40 family metallo-hydrolase [Bdellovibrio bacteriovorus]
MKTATMALFMFVATSAMAHVPDMENFETKPILADLKDLRALNIPVLAKDERIEVGYAIVTPLMQQRIQERSHQVGKCGGFEDLSLDMHVQGAGFNGILDSLAKVQEQNALYDRAPFAPLALERNTAIESALTEVSEDNLRSYVTWLSSFPSRSNRDAEPNRHVDEMKTRLEAMLAESKIPYEISQISHTSTKQRSLKVRLVGSERPNEIVVLGGHLDSINQSWGGGKTAPGADDNASGSANLIEALRILMSKAQPKRTIEIFWYAGEESGLLGSAEIAKQYKAEKKDVVAVLQLDMTLFPGSGELVIGSMTDFTSSWLRDYLKAANETYIHARIVDDKCGYGCSDHASWNRQGYPALMPFEATFSKSNKNIHSTRDVITPESNFKHSAAYTKIAVVMGMDLANSDARQPY